MKHKEKIKLARRFYDKEMRDKKGKLHRKKGIGIFDTEAWQKRKDAINTRVKRKEALTKFHAHRKKKEREVISDKQGYEDHKTRKSKR